MEPDDIRDLVLGFFKAVGSSISDENGAYRITVPERYGEYFGSTEMLVAFDAEASARHGCELVLAGNRILSLVIANCSKKGPIALRQARIGTGRTVIRYHFFVSYTGMSRLSKIMHVDIDWKTLKPSPIEGSLKATDFELESMDSSRFTPAYVAALDELKTKCSGMKEVFLETEQAMFDDDYEIFAGKYGRRIRELDAAAGRYDVAGDPRGRGPKFKIIRQIEDLEKEQDAVSGVLQEKHKVVLSHELVGCEVIRA